VPDSKLGLDTRLLGLEVEQLDDIVVDVVDDDVVVEVVVDDDAAIKDVVVTMHEQAELYGDGLVPQAEVARVG
jgi:hypothetical protein